MCWFASVILWSKAAILNDQNVSVACMQNRTATLPTAVTPLLSIYNIFQEALRRISEERKEKAAERQKLVEERLKVPVHMAAASLSLSLSRSLVQSIAVAYHTTNLT